MPALPQIMRWMICWRLISREKTPMPGWYSSPLSVLRFLSAALRNDVEREGGFAHGGACGENDEVGFLETAGQLVEAGVSGGDAGDLLAAFAAVDDVEIDFLCYLAEGEKVVDAAPFDDFEDLLFGVGEEGFGVKAFGVGVVGNLDAGADEASDEGFFVDDVGVVHHIARGNDVGFESGEVGGAADAFEEVSALEFVDEDDGVDGFLGLGEFEDDAENLLVAGVVEVFGGENGHDIGDGVVIDVESAQDGLFGVEIVGWGAKFGL